MATGLTCVAVTCTPSYSCAAAEAERRVANWDSLALALRVNGTTIPLGWRPLYLISYLVFIQPVPPPSGITYEYLGLHLCTLPVICIFLLASSPHYLLTVQRQITSRLVSTTVNHSNLLHMFNSNPLTSNKLCLLMHLCDTTEKPNVDERRGWFAVCSINQWKPSKPKSSFCESHFKEREKEGGGGLTPACLPWKFICKNQI